MIRDDREKEIREGALECGQREALELHLHPEHGSRYWRERARELGISAGELETVGDLARFGRFDVELLRRRPLQDFIPEACLAGEEQVSPLCTGGATAAPCWAAFTEDEFEEAFLSPFRVAAAWSGFPRGGRWLYVGPTGAHPIGRAADRCARWASGHGAFSIDFDPRWARSLSPGSFARERYLAHVVAQATEILLVQEITVLFSTPPVLAALAAGLPAVVREQIEGVHHGGMAATQSDLERLALEGYPSAVFMAGYGNSLVGMSPQLPSSASRDLVTSGATAPIAYATASGRVRFQVVDDDAAAALSRGEPPRQVQHGERGQVLVSRLDRSFLIINHLERDEATRLAPNPVAIASGLGGTGLGDPLHREDVHRIGGQGLY